MKTSVALCVLVALLAVSPAQALEKKAFQLREDFGAAPLFNCALQYYYYIPCPSYSWFWAFAGWEYGDMVGTWFEIGDLSTHTYTTCDPSQCHILETVRVLDLAAYGTPYPLLHAVQFDVFCCDAYGCPVGPSLWDSGRIMLGYSWNYIFVDPPLSICLCSSDPGPPPTAPRVLVTATHVGYSSYYPAWGTDNISAPLEQGCSMHDFGCLPALYPRPATSHYPTMHSGYYGKDFMYCPPLWFKDQGDTTSDGSLFGFVELAWRIYMACTGPTETEAATWSSIKSMYR